jgi:ethanolamine utilization protein EutJ
MTSGGAADLLGRAAARSALAGQPGERAALPAAGPLRTGVDLGTASCVLVVLDGTGEPVWVDSQPSAALRDGVVVDFAAAERTVRLLREHAELALGADLDSAAAGYPPGIPEADARASRYVCEAAGFGKVALVDEVTAAQRTLGVRDGVIVDVGGGSAGAGAFRGGELLTLDDRPGGGHHLDLVLAGALGIGTEEAEACKREEPRACLPHAVPWIERIAESIRLMTAGAEDLPLHLAGGALMLPGADEIIASYLGRDTVSYPHALLITPLGIARSAP